MIIDEIIICIMILCMFSGLMIGFPVAFTLSGIALLFALGNSVFGNFDLTFITLIPQRIFGNVMWNEILLAVPLFIFMGLVLERSKVAEDLLITMNKIFRDVRGGMGISVIIVGAMLAASTGIVGATVVAMGLLSLKPMLRHGYSPSLTTGSIAAAGTLGQIIPPSIVLIILGEQISNAYTLAQRNLGNFAPDPISIGDLFAAALIPSLILVGIYIIYMIVITRINPQIQINTSTLIQEEKDKKLKIKDVLYTFLAPIVLIVSVLGSIVFGLATPTEASSIGACGALLLGSLRVSDQSPRPIYLAFISIGIVLIISFFLDLNLANKDLSTLELIATVVALICMVVTFYGIAVAVYRIKKVGSLNYVIEQTLKISSMVFMVLIGASVFTLVFRGLGGEEFVHKALLDIPGGLVTTLIVVMLVIFLLGFILDFIEISFIVIPIMLPALFMLGCDPLWLGILLAFNLQTSFLTPPFGFSIFYLRSVTPSEIDTIEIYKGVIPFICIQIFVIGILAFQPSLTTWLPNLLNSL